MATLAEVLRENGYLGHTMELLERLSIKSCVELISILSMPNDQLASWCGGFVPPLCNQDQQSLIVLRYNSNLLQDLRKAVDEMKATQKEEKRKKQQVERFLLQFKKASGNWIDEYQYLSDNSEYIYNSLQVINADNIHIICKCGQKLKICRQGNTNTYSWNSLERHLHSKHTSNLITNYYHKETDETEDTAIVLDSSD